MKTDIKLPEAVALIIDRLNRAGYRADIVGGPVRDFLLGKEPHDFDITTPATPDEVKAVFSDLRIADTGIKHGTVSIIINHLSYEVTTYRIDGEYKDSRHPESVTFTDRLSEDLARRDFTVNAICYNPRDGITDLYGGREDIQRRILRAVGEPEKRFTEDALRILRGARFSATLGFEIEGGTLEAMLRTRGLLSGISAERIYSEWKKTLEGDYAYEALSGCRAIFEEVIPELGNLRLPSRERFSGAPFLPKMLSLFVLTRGEGAREAFISAADRLRVERITRNVGAQVLSAVGKYQVASLTDAGRLLSELGTECAEVLLSVEEILGASAEAKRLMSYYLKAGLPYRIRDLAVGGDDMLALGVLGKDIGDTLSLILEETVAGRLENTREAQLAFARKHREA